DLGHQRPAAGAVQLALGERAERVLVGDPRVAETWAPVAHVGGVVHLLEAVEAVALLPLSVVRRDVADGAPAGAAEGLGQVEPVTGEHLVVALLRVDPE